MRIIANTTVCIGAGMCALTAPEVFDQGDDDGLVRPLLPYPPDEFRDAVALAVRLCPSGALRLDETDRTDPAEGDRECWSDN